MTSPDIGEQILHLDVRTTHGLFKVASASATEYFLQIYPEAGLAIGRLLRRPGVGSSRMGGDNEWVPLLSVQRAEESADDITWTDGVVTVGHRHMYWLAPRHRSDAGWWIQRRATAIARLHRVPPLA